MNGSSTFNLYSFGQTFLMAPMATLGFFPNLVCLIVNLSPDLQKISTFNLMLAMSVADFFLSIIFIFQVLGTCQIISCATYKSFFSLFWLVYPFNFICNILEVFGILMEISIALERIFILNNSRKALKHFRPKLIIAVSLIFSTLFYLPYAFQFDIINLVNSNGTVMADEFTSRLSSFKTSNVGKVILSTVALSRAFVFSLAIVVLNVLLVLKMRALMKRKKVIKINGDVESQLRSIEISNDSETTNKSSTKVAQHNLKEKRAEQNMGKMAICICVNHLIGNLPLSFTQIYKQFVNGSTTVTQYLLVISNFMDSLSHSTLVFIFLKYNKTFKKQFKKLTLSLLKKLKIK